MEEGMERERDKRRETGFQHRADDKWGEREKRERGGRGPVLTR